MNAQTNLIAQLDDALGQSDIGRRAEILRQVTDLFVAGSGSFAGEQISLFDDVSYIPLHQQALAWGVSKKTHVIQRPDNYYEFYWVNMD